MLSRRGKRRERGPPGPDAHEQGAGKTTIDVRRDAPSIRFPEPRRTVCRQNQRIGEQELSEGADDGGDQPLGHAQRNQKAAHRISSGQPGRLGWSPWSFAEGHGGRVAGDHDITILIFETL